MELTVPQLFNTFQLLFAASAKTIRVWCVGFCDSQPFRALISALNQAAAERTIVCFVTDEKGGPLKITHQSSLGAGVELQAFPLVWTNPLGGEKADVIIFGSLDTPFHAEDLLSIFSKSLHEGGKIIVSNRNHLPFEVLEQLKEVPGVLNAYLPSTYNTPVETKREMEKLKETIRELTEINTSLSEANEQINNLYHGQLEESSGLRKTLGRLRDMTFSIPDWVWEINEEGILTFVAGNVMDVLGYQPEELLGRSITSLVADENSVNKTFLTGLDFHNNETYFLTKQGKRVCLLTSAVPFQNNNGQLKGFRGTSRDISEAKAIQEELNRRKQHLELALEVAGMGTWQYDLEQGQFNISDKVYQLYQETKDSNRLIDTPFWKGYLHPDDRDWVIEHIDKAIKDKTPYAIEFRVILKDGNQRWQRSVGKIFDDTNTNRPQLIGVVYDITQQRESEEALKDSKKFIESIAATVPGVITVYDRDTHQFVFVNDAVERMLGISTSFMLKAGMKNVFSLLHPDDSQKLIGLYQKKIKGANNYTVSFRMRRQDGKYIWMRSYGVVFSKNKNGQVRQVLNITIDIHQNKLTEQRLVENEEKYRDLVEYAPMGVLVHNPTGILFANSTAVRMLKGQRLDQIIGKDIFDFIDSNYHALVQMRINSALKEKKSSSLTEQRFIAIDGSPIDVEVLGTPVIYNGTQAIQTTFYDVTEKKKAEEALHRSNLLLESINQNIKEAIYRSKPDGSILYANNAFLQMFGYAQDHPLSQIKTNMLYYNLEDRDRLLVELESEGIITNQEFLFKKSDNTTFWGSLTSSLIQDASGELFFDGAIRDITDQKRAEEKLKQSERSYRMLMENANDALVITDHDTGILIDANKVAAKMLGRSLEEIKEMHFSALHPEEEKERYKQLFYGSNASRHFISGGNYLHIVDKEGNRIPVDIRSSLINTGLNGKNVILSIFRDMTERNAFEQELTRLNYQLLERNNELIKQEQELASSNEALKKNQEQMEKVLKELSDRNFELDQLVYKTSHDIRSPLTSILGLINIYQLEDEIEKKDESISMIQGRIMKLDEFVRSMLSYAKTNRSPLKIEPIDFEEIINSCLSDLEFIPGFSLMDVQINMIGKEIPFFCDKLRLQIVFSNIISNAFKYMRTTDDQSYLQIRVEINNSLAFVTFQDNGIGIEQQYLNRIFDMFFRATERSDGSGLGMYIVKQTIDRLRGSIYIESQVNIGTTIQLELPSL